MKVHYALIEYENRKAKPAHFLVQIDFDDPNDQRQKWFSERRQLVTDPTLARASDFYNIYHQSWALIEHEKMLMHWGNTTFGCDNEFKECMKLEGVV